MPLEPCLPGPPDPWRQDEAVPETKELVCVDVETDIVIGAFLEHKLIDASPVGGLSKIEGQVGTAPPDVVWEPHLPGRLVQPRRVEILGCRDRAGRWPEEKAARTGHG